MNQQQLEEIYEMVDSVPLSRPKKNINRDFSDGLLMAEIIHHYSPKIVATHNYPPSNAVTKKIVNWTTLNNKVLKKIGIALSKPEIEDLANSIPGAIERVLYQVLLKFQKPEEEGRLSQNAKRMEKMERFQAGQQMRKDQPFDRDAEAQGLKIQVDQPPNLMMFYESNRNRSRTHEHNEEMSQLVDCIEQANSQLLKLSELNKAKEEMIMNLERKLQKILLG